MKRALNLAGIAFLFTFFCHISITSSMAADGATEWSVASVTGTARFKADTSGWQTLSKGTQVGVGHQIRTESGGSVVLTRNDESVRIGPKSSFEMKPASNGMLTRIFQEVGTLMFKVHKQSSKHFEVQTPHLVAAVKGTTFTVSVDNDGGAVHVVEGLVEVGSLRGSDRILVRPGKTASVGAAGDSKVQIGVTPSKAKKQNGKQSKAPTISRDLGVASVDIQKSSKGLLKSGRNPVANQLANNASNKKSGAAENGLALGLGNGGGNGGGLALGLGNGGGNGGGLALGLGNGGGNGGGLALGLGNGGGNGGGLALGLGNGGGNGGGLTLGLGNGGGNGGGLALGLGNGGGLALGLGKGKGKK